LISSTSVFTRLPDRLRDHRPQPRGSALAGRPHRRAALLAVAGVAALTGKGRIQQAVPPVPTESAGTWAAASPPLFT
jgi:hypothetical protein